MTRSYVRDGAEIYRRSFATIRAEADLVGPAAGRRPGRGPDDPRLRAGRPRRRHRLHPRRRRGRPRRRCGPARRSCATRRWSPPASPARGCPRTTRWSARCATRGSRRSRRGSGTTRSAAALELWRDRLDGAVVAIGNAPTALFHLLDMIDAGAPRPAAVLGIPVGFIGAAESKEALAAHATGLEYLVVRGRRGGSAITAAAVNAIASESGDDLAGRSASDGAAVRRRPRPGRPGAGDGQGRPAHRRGRRDRLPQRPARPLDRPPHRRAVPARRSDRGAAGLPGHHRDHRPSRRLPGRDRRVLRRGRRAAGRAPRRRPRRRRARRGRPALLRLLHAHAQAAGRPLRGRGRAGRHLDQRRVGRPRAAAGRARRGAHRAARHPAARRAGPPARRHRLRRDHEARPHLRRRPRCRDRRRPRTACYVERATTDGQRTAAARRRRPRLGALLLDRPAPEPGRRVPARTPVAGHGRQRGPSARPQPASGVDEPAVVCRPARSSSSAPARPGATG